MTAERSFDVVCIGAGPCGEAVTAELRGSGLSLAVVESALVGGECPYWGCMPSKTLIRAAETLTEGRRSLDMAASSAVFEVDFPKAAARTAWMAREWNDSGAASDLESNGATLVRAAGRVAGERLVETDDGSRLRATRAVVVATGTRPAVPSIPGLEGVQYWTNREAVKTKELPASLIVVGGGAVGVELAQAFARFRCRVTVVQVAPRLVPAEEPEAGALLQSAFEAEGITVLTRAKIEGVSAEGSGVRLGSVVAGRLLLATGRAANLDGFDLAGTGASLTERGFLRVDPHSLLAAPGLYGGGDVNGIWGFTHVSHYHGTLIGRALRGGGRPANHDAIPRVTFTDPEIASVGITEAAARERGLDVAVASADVANTARGYIHDAKLGLVKLVADRSAGLLVGATIVSPRAGEMIGELALAIRAGVPLAVLDDTVHAFPTFSRVLQGLFAELSS